MSESFSTDAPFRGAKGIFALPPKPYPLIPVLICIVLVAWTLGVYWPACQNGFVDYDDPLYVTNNPHVKEGLTEDNIRWAFTSTSLTSNWHPLTWLSLMLDTQIYEGQNAWGFHFTNLLFHAANTVLLFLALFSMTGAAWRCAFVAALFALHPLRVESVAWISERKDVLSTFFWMLTLLAYTRYVRQPGWKRYLTVLLPFALGLMSKPMLVTLPFVLLLLDYWPLRRFGGSAQYQLPGTQNARSVRKLLLEKLPLIILSIGACLITLHAQNRAIRSSEDYPFIIRLGNAVLAYATYIEKTLWPINLAVFYPHPGAQLQWWQVALAGLLLLIVSIPVWIYRQACPYLLVGWCWFLGTLVPMIGLVQVGQQALADRYTYVPLIGLFVMGVWGIADLASRWHGEWIAAAGGVALVGSLSSLTVLQIRHWVNNETLWQHALDAAGGNATAHNNLGVALRKNGKLPEAIFHYHAALRYDKDDAAIHNNLGIALLRHGEPKEAAHHLSQAYKLKPDLPGARFYLGVAYAMQGETGLALPHFQNSGRDNAIDLIQIDQYLAGLLSSGDNPKVGARPRKDPRWGQVYYLLGRTLLPHSVPDAVECFAKAVELQPGNLTYRLFLTGSLERQGRFQEAKEQRRKAISYDPDWLKTADNLAWTSLAPPCDAEVAVMLGEQVCQDTDHLEAKYLDTLAAAYAASDRFEEAVQTAEKALKRAEEAGQEDLAKAIKKRLDLYRGRKPAHKS